MYDGIAMLKEAATHLRIHLSDLVAATSLWANPEVHSTLVAENGTGSFFPNMRRCRPGAGERRGQLIGVERLDDNSYANHAIKQATGISRSNITGFEACHIWPGTSYDNRYHTVIANLVLLPRPLAGLSDHDPEIQAVLQFRAYELYGWHPKESTPPKEPDYYPKMWTDLRPFTEKVKRALVNRRLQHS